MAQSSTLLVFFHSVDMATRNKKPMDLAISIPSSSQESHSPGPATPVVVNVTQLPSPIDQPGPKTQRRYFSTPLPQDHRLIASVINGDVLQREPSDALSSLDAVYTGQDMAGAPQAWRYVRLLGKGSFSLVCLGQTIGASSLVAIKITNIPQDRNKLRIESALARELDILRTISHPNIIRILGTVISDNHILILEYYKGGDLFEFALKHRAQTSPQLIRRMYAEVVSAVSYLHANWIIHRDIKLENILLKYDSGQLLSGRGLLRPIVTLTDFGLAKRIDPEHYMLDTRCGSEDYVAPELIMGLEYDGRATDTWSLGVLLYALMEGRLPFDPPPPVMNPVTGTVRSLRKLKVSHRIARVEWSWYFFSGKNSANWDPKVWGPAKSIVENTLVKRDVRWTSQKINDLPWCADLLAQASLTPPQSTTRAPWTQEDPCTRAATPPPASRENSLAPR